ncbi:MAG: phasin family protein [Candidatus Xenobia bacterium]
MALLTMEQVFMAGIGASVIAKERIEETLNHLIKKGELSQGQAQKVVDELTDKAREEGNVFETKAREQLRKFFHEQGLVMADDFRKLEERVTALTVQVEALNEKLEGGKPKAAAGKV